MRVNYKYMLLIGCIFALVIIVYFYNKSYMEGMNVNSGPFDKYPLPNVLINANTALYTAIIVEPRKHNALEFVLNNFWENLDESWTFVILHGKDNEEFVKNIVNKSKNVKRTQLVNIGVSNLSVSQYSELFYNPLLYNYIPTETFLVFQTDSIILKENRNKVYDFMRYDYVGAPWPPGIPIRDENIEILVGNGGLSLRKKTAILNTIKSDIANTRYENNEDLFFSKHIKNKPSVEKAQFFCIESLYSEKSFGIHGCWKFFPKIFIYYISEYIPELFDLIYLLESNK